jgi:hypothetical protein
MQDPIYMEFRAMERDHAEKMRRCWASLMFIVGGAVLVIAAGLALWQ